MAKIVRKALKQFGLSGVATNFGQYGSKVAGSPQTSKDPDIIQQLSAWVNGWQSAISGGDKAPYLQDMNGWCFVHSYMVAYLLQTGIPEWNTSTVYYINSVVQDNAGGGQWFVSLQDDNQGHAPPASASDAFWKWVNPQAVLDGGITVNKIPIASATAPGKLVDGPLSVVDAGANLKTTLPIKFPDNTIQATAAANPNAFTVQSPPSAYAGPIFTRAVNVVYHNTGSKPRMVNIYAAVGTGGAFQAFCDGNPVPVQRVGRFSVTSNTGEASGSGTLSFIVLPGYYYKITGAAPATWVEWT